MEKQTSIMTHGPAIVQKHLLKNSPTVHEGEPVEIPPLPEFERGYADNPTTEKGEAVQLPVEVIKAEREAKFKLEMDEMADDFDEIYEDRAAEEAAREENARKFREGQS